MRSTQPCNHRLCDQLIRRDWPSSPNREFGRSNRLQKNSARGDAGRVKWRKASEFSKTRSRHLWAPSIRGPRALATYTYRWVPTSNRPNRRGRPHLGDTYISLWFASSRPHRCKPRRPTPSLHQQASRPTVTKTALPRCFIAISLSFRSCGENVSLAIWLPSRGKRAKWNSFHPRRLIEQVGVHPQPISPRDTFARAREANDEALAYAQPGLLPV